MGETNREHFFGDERIGDAIALLSYSDHPREECRLFRQSLNIMAYHGTLKAWLDSEKDPRFNW